MFLQECIQGFANEPGEGHVAHQRQLHQPLVDVGLHRDAGYHDVGIPSMAELGFSEEEIPMLARIAYEDPQTIGNPREVDATGYEEIYRNSFARGKR